jgi:CheY-specific phosphatase CheX
LSDDDFAIEYQKIKSFKDSAEQVLKDKMLAEAREKERIQEIENQRRDQLFEIGFGTFGGTFNYKGFLKTTPSIIYSLSDEEFDSFKNLAIEKIKEIQAEELANAQGKIKSDLEAKAKKEAEELALKSANAPDKEKLLEFAKLLDQVVLPVVSGEYANKIAFNTQGLIKKTVTYLTTQIQENL